MKYRTKSITSKAIADYTKQVENLIATHGWMVQAVFATDTEPGFAYTVGLSAKGLPELIVFALPPQHATAILNQVAQTMVNIGNPYPEWGLIAEVMEGANCMVVNADRDKTDNYMFQAKYRYPDYKAMQLVWTDLNMKFPWEDGFDPDLIRLQPLMFDYRPQ